MAKIRTGEGWVPFQGGGTMLSSFGAKLRKSWFVAAFVLAPLSLCLSEPALAQCTGPASNTICTLGGNPWNSGHANPEATSLPLRNYVAISMTCMLAVLFQLARHVFQCLRHLLLRFDNDGGSAGEAGGTILGSSGSPWRRRCRQGRAPRPAPGLVTCWTGDRDTGKPTRHCRRL